MTTAQTPAITGTAWDGWAAVSVGLAMRRTLSMAPPPDDSRFGADLERWSGRLIAHGRYLMAEAGERHLSAVTS